VTQPASIAAQPTAASSRIATARLGFAPEGSVELIDDSPCRVINPE
jgi:hypothetical protein